MKDYKKGSLGKTSVNTEGFAPKGQKYPKGHAKFGNSPVPPNITVKVSKLKPKKQMGTTRIFDSTTSSKP